LLEEKKRKGKVARISIPDIFNKEKGKKEKEGGKSILRGGKRG